MTTPLYPHLAPLTFSWGFLQTGLPQGREKLVAWVRGFVPQCEITHLDGPLDDVLGQMQPLTLPASKRLLVSTQSDWVACFDNGANGADLLSLMTTLTSRLNCCGLVIRCATDRRMFSPQDRQDHFTHLGLEVFQPEAEPLVGPTRLVSLSQYYGKWKFTQNGDPLPGENVANYKASPIYRRLTLEGIDTFCQSLGLFPFTPSFYLPNSCLFTMRGVTKYPVSRTLVEAQAVFASTPSPN